MVCGGTTRRTAAHSVRSHLYTWFGNQTSSFLFENKVTNQSKDCRFPCTLYRAPHNVHVCKQLDWSVILDIQCTQVWSREEYTFHAAQECSDEIWQTVQCHRAKVRKNMSILNCQTKDQLTLLLLTNKRLTDTFTEEQDLLSPWCICQEHRLWTIRVVWANK